jgi:hypothetical protein
MAKSTKLTKQIQRLGGKIWAGVLYIWNRPVIVSGILLALTVLLFNIIIKQTFKPYTNCGYLLGNKLGMPSFFCDGYTVRDPVFNSEIFTIPGLRGAMDPPLEFARTIISWTVVLFFAFVSVYLTIMVNNFKSVIRLVTFNKEEWKRFMSSLRVWFLFFVTFCAIFYFTVIK